METSPARGVPAHTDITIWDETTDQSVINIVPARIRELMLVVKKEAPNLFQMDEQQLKAACDEAGKKINPRDNRIRILFWQEYNNTLFRGKTFRISAAFGGEIEPINFYTYFMTNPYRVAWMLLPPAQYALKLEEALDHATDRMRALLDEPIKNSKGKIDYKMAELQFRIFSSMEQRLHGGYTQRIEQKSLHIGVKGELSEKGNVPETMDAIQARLKELNELNLKAQNVQLTQSVSPGEVEVDSEVVEEGNPAPFEGV